MSLIGGTHPNPMKRKKCCKHEYEQVDKEFYVSESDGMIGKKLIDVCQKCGKRRER